MAKLKRPEERKKSKAVVVNDSEELLEMVDIQKKGKETMREKRSKHPILKTRSSPNLICEVLQSLNAAQRKCIYIMGFGPLARMDITEIPARISWWILQSFDTVSCTIKMRKSGKEIRITSKDAERYLGIPIGTRKIVVGRYHLLSPIIKDFRRQFGCHYNEETQQETIKELTAIKPKDVAELLKTTETADDWFKRNFIVLLVSVMFESNPNGSVNAKILDILFDADSIRD